MYNDNLEEVVFVDNMTNVVYEDRTNHMGVETRLLEHTTTETDRRKDEVRN